MINGATLTPARASYLEGQVATSREDYYAGHGESAGRWFGHGATALGLEGAVLPGQLEPLLDGVHPLTRERLRRAVRRAASSCLSRPGYWRPVDDYARAPASRWIRLRALRPEEHQCRPRSRRTTTGREILAAHHAAVDAALTLLEQEAAFVRTGTGGVVRERASGIAAALYTHRLSRNLDPQLHTHCAIANLAQTGGDENWRTLDSQTLLRRWKLTIGYAYRAHLRHEISARLGWSFTATFPRTLRTHRVATRCAA